MAWNLGLLGAAGGGGAAGAYEWLETTVLSGTQTSVTFSNLDTNYASTYQHLQLRSVVRGSSSGSSNNGLYLQMNGDTATSYAFHRLEGASSVVSIGFANADGILIGITPQSGATTNAFAVSVADILDPFESGKNRTVRALSGVLGTSVPAVALQSGFRNNTAAISSLKIYADAGSFVSGSRFSLYGMRSS